ncbi:hypothetical protein CEXT_566421 [Caerostris extrusa]|uniref:Uncharacterized protein n=1 Tax=Caerostris extrusa TaxID=172846 RepID=A0AAV4UN46_CAEEX|nr:hypothetical protein CEXT_566421 [Caerostris extrusa]
MLLIIHRDLLPFFLGKEKSKRRVALGKFYEKIFFERARGFYDPKRTIRIPSCEYDEAEEVAKLLQTCSDGSEGCY